MIAQFRRLAREKPLVLFAWMLAFLLAYGFASTDLNYAFSHEGWRSGPGALLGPLQLDQERHGIHPEAGDA